MKNPQVEKGRMTASGVAAASPFDALSFSEYSESSSVCIGVCLSGGAKRRHLFKTSTRHNLNTVVNVGFMVMFTSSRFVPL